MDVGDLSLVFVLDTDRARLHRSMVLGMVDELKNEGFDSIAVVPPEVVDEWGDGALALSQTGWSMFDARRVVEFQRAVGSKLKRRSVLVAIGERSWRFVGAISAEHGMPMMLVVPPAPTPGSLTKAHARLSSVSPVLWVGPTPAAEARLVADGVPASSFRRVPWGTAVPEDRVHRDEVGGSVSLAVGGEGLDARSWSASLEGISRVVRTRDDCVVFIDASAVRRAKLWDHMKRLGLHERASIISFEGASRELVLGCDVMVLPDPPETRPSLLLGSMARGAGVVTVDTDADGLVSAQTGVLVPKMTKGDPASWTSGVSAILDDPALAHRLGEAARAFVVEHHSLVGSAASLIEGSAWLVGERSIPFGAKKAGG